MCFGRKLTSAYGRNKTNLAHNLSLYHLKIALDTLNCKHSPPLPCREFRERNGKGGALKVKLCSLFRGSSAREFTRIFQSPSDTFGLEPPLTSNIGYAWLSNPQKTVEIDERDLVFFEETSRLPLRAAKFSEVVLQSWDANLKGKNCHIKMMSCLSIIVKSVTQTQTSITFGTLQLRRNHFLPVRRVSRMTPFNSYVMLLKSSLYLSLPTSRLIKMH